MEGTGGPHAPPSGAPPQLAAGLQERGEVLVKGRGRMATCWLRFPGSADPDHCADHDELGK